MRRRRNDDGERLCAVGGIRTGEWISGRRDAKRVGGIARLIRMLFVKHINWLEMSRLLAAGYGSCAPATASSVLLDLLAEGLAEELKPQARHTAGKSASSFLGDDVPLSVAAVVLDREFLLSVALTGASS